MFIGQRAAPPLGGTARWLVLLEVTYLFRINFCSAWICLLIEAINATIDFRTSAFETVADDALIEYFTVFAVSFVNPVIPRAN